MICRFSSSVARKTSVTWSVQLFPNSVTTSVPALSKVARVGSSSGRIAHAAGAAKCDNFGIAKFAVAHALKKFEVLGIGRIRPAAFDVVNAHRVETLRDHGFVFSRKRDALGLRAVSKGRIVDFHLFRHVISFG